jgi:hypothetical protein
MLTLSLGAALTAATIPAFGQAFPDTPENHWAYQAVLGAKAAGFLVGYPDGTFKGPRPASRYEMAAALYALYMNLKGISDGLGNQVNALSRKVDGISTDGFATKAELAELKRALDALKATIPGAGKDYGAEIEAMKKMASTFEKELASQGVDIEALKKGVTDLDNRVKILEGKKMPVNISGDLNLVVLGGYSIDGENGTTVDNRMTGAPRAGSTNTGIGHDLTVGHEAAMTIAGNNDTGPKWRATFVTGNLTGEEWPGTLFGNQSHIWEDTPFRESKQDFYIQNAEVMIATSLFGQNFNARLGRVGHKVHPMLFQRPDNTPYFWNTRWDNGEWVFDGGIFDFHFGSSTFTIFGGRDGGNWDNLLTSNEVPINNMQVGSAGHIFSPGTSGLDSRPRGYGDHLGVGVDQHLGTSLSIPLGSKGNVNLAYMIFDQNAETFIGSSTLVNRAIVFGGDVKYMFGERLSFNAGYAQTNMAGDSTTVVDEDNAAFWAGVNYNADRWSAMLGYKSIDPQYYAPGAWGRIGIWWNPTDIQGFNGSLSFNVNDRISLGVYGGFWTGREITLNGVTGLTKDDKINHIKAHLNYKVNEDWDLMLGGEFVNWDLASRGTSFAGGKPEERWYNLGLKYHMGENAFWSFLWQVSDYDAKGTAGFNPFGTSATVAKGGLLTTQVGIKY